MWRDQPSLYQLQKVILLSLSFVFNWVVNYVKICHNNFVKLSLLIRPEGETVFKDKFSTKYLSANEVFTIIIIILHWSISFVFQYCKIIFQPTCKLSICDIVICPHPASSTHPAQSLPIKDLSPRYWVQWGRGRESKLFF